MSQLEGWNEVCGVARESSLIRRIRHGAYHRVPKK